MNKHGYIDNLTTTIGFCFVFLILTEIYVPIGDNFITGFSLGAFFFVLADMCEYKLDTKKDMFIKLKKYDVTWKNFLPWNMTFFMARLLGMSCLLVIPFLLGASKLSVQALDKISTFALLLGFAIVFFMLGGKQDRIRDELKEENSRLRSENEKLKKIISN